MENRSADISTDLGEEENPRIGTRKWQTKER